MNATLIGISYLYDTHGIGKHNIEKMKLVYVMMEATVNA
jgi:hypothetical protein